MAVPVASHGPAREQLCRGAHALVPAWPPQLGNRGAGGVLGCCLGGPRKPRTLSGGNTADFANESETFLPLPRLAAFLRGHNCS